MPIRLFREAYIYVTLRFSLVVFFIISIYYYTATSGFYDYVLEKDIWTDKWVSKWHLDMNDLLPIGDKYVDDFLSINL